MEADQSCMELPAISIQPPSPRSDTTKESHTKTDVNQNRNIPSNDNHQICVDNETRASECELSSSSIADTVEGDQCGLKNAEQDSSLNTNESKDGTELHSGINDNRNSDTIEETAKMKDLSPVSPNHLVNHERQSSSNSDSSGEFIPHTNESSPSPGTASPTQTPMDTMDNQESHLKPVTNGHALKLDSISVNGFADDSVSTSSGRSPSTKSNSLNEADFRDQERPTVQRRASKKSMNSAVFK